MRKTIVAVVMACAALLAGSAEAQIQKGLEYSLTPYIWGVSLNGKTGTGRATATVDASFSDLLDVADIVVPIHFEAKGPVWTLLAEINYTGLSQDIKAGRGTTGGADVDMLIAELLSGYQLSDSFELLFGARYVDIETKVKINPGVGAPSLRFDSGQDWIDPLVGFRYGGPISRRWRFLLRGDIGGFGLGSELTWNLRTGFGVEVSDVTTLWLGWHQMDFNYDSNNFVYDMTHSGPEFGASFKF